MLVTSLQDVSGLVNCSLYETGVKGFLNLLIFIKEFFIFLLSSSIQKGNLVKS